MAARVVACPQCGKNVVWDASSPWRPFCSERCRLIDLGAWASESYRIPVSGNNKDEIETPADPDADS